MYLDFRCHLYKRREGEMVSFYTIKADMTIDKNMVENKKKITVKNRLKFL